jgi:hypothetical protein
MKLAISGLFLLAAAIVFVSGCGRSEADAGEQETPLSFQEIASPARPGSGEPNLYAAPNGAVFLSWIEPGTEKQHALRFAQFEDKGWSAPSTIAEDDTWFINWADFPSLIAFGDDALAAHFLARSGADTYAYDVQITLSHDGGRTWSPAIRPHRDDTRTEHGFVSMLPWHSEQLLAVWLDGRNTGGGEDHSGHGGEGAMTLRAATVAGDGTLAAEALLDERICDCCQTSAARTPHGAVVAYRDRSPEEIRDIAVVRLGETGWSEPTSVHDDGWHINGCPVNGPAVAAAGASVAVAWFTAAQDTPRVQLAFSSDEGASFGPPSRVDDGHPIGRVDVVMAPQGEALVSWIEQTNGGADIRVRRLAPDGTAQPAVIVAPTSVARASGFPRLALHDPYVYIAWTDVAEESLIRTALAPL